jgi:hypothetical protein
MRGAAASIDAYLERYDQLPNIQVLAGIPNIVKAGDGT